MATCISGRPGRVKLLPDAITELSDDAVSPDGRWVVAAHAVPENQHVPFARMAFSLGGGTPITICHNCSVGWAPGGQFFYVTLERRERTKTLLVPVSPDRSLPTIPLAGIQTAADMANIRDVKVLDGEITLGPASGLSAESRRNVHRNLYSIPLK